MKVPALYEMEPIGTDGALEANGRVYFFCPDKDCRDLYHETLAATVSGDVAFGWDDNYSQGTVCDQCGELLEPDTTYTGSTISEVQEAVKRVTEVKP